MRFFFDVSAYTSCYFFVFYPVEREDIGFSMMSIYQGGLGISLSRERMTVSV